MVIAGLELDLNEFKELVVSAGVDVIDTILGNCQSPKAKYFIGLGKAEEIKLAVLAQSIDVVIVNHDLSPSQERNLEKLIECRVLSRSGLILDIFAQRARTFEGKLQVELAQLQHLQTRLVRGWTHLERQKGGIGLRGPGETQLESDRRLLRERIKTINSRLAKVHSQREENRRSRQKSDLPLVSLVGYTNAGKSTLFNRLTNSDSLVEDQLFATLDPLMRKICLPNNSGVILSDTVGFIQNLPHQLVEAFKGTLEETKGADLLLHVVDIASNNYLEHIQVVNDVLSEIGAESVPVILVFNKIDLLGNSKGEISPKLNLKLKLKQIDGQRCMMLSSKTGVGVKEFVQTLMHEFYGEVKDYQLTIQPEQGKVRALLYQKDAVLEETTDDLGQSIMKVRLCKKDHQEIRHLLLG